MHSTFNRLRLVLIVLLLASATSTADAQTTLRLKFEKGKSNAYELLQTLKLEQNTLGQTINLTIKQSMQLKMTCDDVEANGNGKITTRIERFGMEIDAPEPVGKIKVDSDSETPNNNPTAARIAPIAKILGQLEFVAVMTPRGETVDFKIPETTLKKLRDIPGAAQFGGGLFTEDGIKNMMVQSKVLLPQEKVSPGATWTNKVSNKISLGKLTGEMKYKYVADEGKLQKIAFDPTLAIEPNAEAQVTIKLDSQKGSGTILFDNAAGRVQELSLNEVMQLSVGNQGVNVTQKIDQMMTMKLR